MYQDELRDLALQQARSQQSRRRGGTSRSAARSGLGVSGGGGGGTGGTMQSSIQALIDSFNQSQQAANAANQARSVESRGILQSNIDALTGIGAQQAADINRQFDSQQTAVSQDLVDRGLSAGTIGGSMRTGVEEARAGSLSRSANDITLLSNQARSQLAQAIINESDTNTGTQMLPSLLALLQSLGQAGGRA